MLSKQSQGPGAPQYTLLCSCSLDKEGSESGLAGWPMEITANHVRTKMYHGDKRRSTTDYGSKGMRSSAIIALRTGTGTRTATADSDRKDGRTGHGRSLLLLCGMASCFWKEEASCTRMHAFETDRPRSFSLELACPQHQHGAVDHTVRNVLASSRSKGKVACRFC